MVNVNKTKESIQNVLIFITDAIALIMSYYMSGFIWLMEIRNNTFSYVMKVLNGNIVTIIIAVLIAALFCNIKGDVLNRGKFEELASVMKKSLISSAVIAVYELLSKTAQGVPRSVYVITFFMGTVLMFLLRMLAKERIFYASVAYLQFDHDTRQLDELRDKGDYKGLLALAKEYYDGNGMDEQHTYASPLQNRGDDLLIEDKDFAVVYNGSVGGTYDIMLKYTEQEVRDHITRYGTSSYCNRCGCKCRMLEPQKRTHYF